MLDVHEFEFFWTRSILVFNADDLHSKDKYKGYLFTSAAASEDKSIQ